MHGALKPLWDHNLCDFKTAWHAAYISLAIFWNFTSTVKNTTTASVYAKAAWWVKKNPMN